MPSWAPAQMLLSCPGRCVPWWVPEQAQVQVLLLRCCGRCVPWWVPEQVQVQEGRPRRPHPRRHRRQRRRRLLRVPQGLPWPGSPALSPACSAPPLASAALERTL